MACTIETYTKRIVDNLECSSKERKDLVEELSGHLKLLVKEFEEKGFEEAAAISLAIEEFGDPELIHQGMQDSIMPERKLIYTVGRLLFGIYSFLIIWKLIITRFIDRVTNLNSSNIYFRIPLDAEGFFSVKTWELNSNILPFLTTYNYITGYENFNLDIILRNTVGNMLIFVPIGFFLIMLVRRLNTSGKVAMVGFTISVSIEISQFFLQVGQFDIDDILLNTFGAILGYAIFKFLSVVWGYLQSSKSKEVIS